MSYRELQLRQQSKNQLAKLQQEWHQLENQYKGDILALQNSLSLLKNQHNEQLRQINLLFDGKAKHYTEPINFNGLLISLKSLLNNYEEKFKELKNYLPRPKEYILKCYDHLDNKAQEFKNWLNENEERKGGLTEWDKVFAKYKKEMKDSKKETSKKPCIEMDIIDNFVPSHLEQKEKYSEIMKKWTIEAGLFTKEEWQEREGKNEELEEISQQLKDLEEQKMNQSSTSKKKKKKK